MSQHDANEVRRWLVSIHMEAYAATFVKGGYDTLASLASADDAELKRLGVKSGHIKLLSRLRKKLASPRSLGQRLAQWLRSINPELERLAPKFAEHGWSCGGGG